MVDTQHFCLRWNNYQSSITSAFENLRDDEDFVDVTLACDGKSLKAHRVVLSACSPYFRELLKSTPCKHPVIVLQDVAWTDLHALVEFIYHGEVNVHQRSLSSFLKTAEVLRVSGLTQQHGDGRDQLTAAVHTPPTATPSLRHPPSHPPTPLPNHHPATYPDKLIDDSLFPSPSSPPHGATVNQLLRRAAMQYRRERRISSDPEAESKRARAELLNNNNNELGLHAPPQTQPADFSPSGMKHSILGLNSTMKNEIEGNGISSTNLDRDRDRDRDRDASPCSPSPTLHSRCLAEPKSEPMELLCSSVGGNPEGGDNSDDSTAGTTENGTGENGPSLPQGPHSGSSTGEHDERESVVSPYLTASESKLFAQAAGGFNFSMAALAADPSALGGLNQSLQGNDTLAGTSQGAASPKKVFTCQRCAKVLCSKASLKRHIADKHAERQEEYRCIICERVYCSRNSLMTHIYTYHKSRPGDVDIKFF